MPYIFGRGWVEDASQTPAAPSLASLASGRSAPQSASQTLNQTPGQSTGTPTPAHLSGYEDSPWNPANNGVAGPTWPAGPERSYGGRSGLGLSPLQESEWQAANALNRTGTGAASRSPMGSYWRLPDGRYFVPQIETPGAVTSGGEGGMDIYGPSSWADYANTVTPYGYKSEGKGYKAVGSTGDYGTVGNFDNTGGILPGYGNGPGTNGMQILGGGDGSRNWGPLQGKFYNNAPTEQEFSIPQDYDFIGDTVLPIVASAVVGGAGAGLWGAGGAAGSGAGAAGGAFDMGIGGIGESMGLGAGYTSPAIGGSSLLENAGNFTGGEATSWGVNPQGGGMDLTDIIEQTGNFTGGEGGGIDWSQYTDFGPGNTGFGEADALNFANSELGQLASSTGLSFDSLKSALGALKAATGLDGKDLLSLAGRLGATGLGMYAADKQSTAMSDLAKRYEGYGAPYRARLADSYANPDAFLSGSPDIQASVRQGTDALARSLSRQGNPTGSGTALQELQNYATQGLYGQLGNERNRLANFGGLSGFNSAAPGLATQSIQSQGGALNALGSGISSITNPPSTLEQALNQINGLQGLKINSGTGW